MADPIWRVRFQTIAQRDFERQYLWLFQNRGQQQAETFEQNIETLIKHLKAFPRLWPTLPHPRQHIRKAVIKTRTLVFYELEEESTTIHILAIRGAAEDWTNQSLPND